ILRHLIALSGAAKGSIMLGNTLVQAHSFGPDGEPVLPVPMNHELVVEASLDRKVVVGPGEGGDLETAVPLTLGRERVGLVYLRLSSEPSTETLEALDAYASFAAQLLFQVNTRALLQRSETSYTEKLDMALGLYDLYADAMGQAITDRMTGLGSKAYLEQRITEQLDHARRHAQPLSLILVDLDHFKAINDTHGHLVGDQVLGGVGYVIRGQLRLSDVAGRFGGEEFAILLAETGSEGALVLAERLRKAIEAWSLELPAGRLKVTASLGVASLEAAMPGAAALVDAADRALYQAKRSGRNQVSQLS
ncbi:MAG TPA: GGDEF domain-containing protein, partial [Stenomitos sp.]